MAVLSSIAAPSLIAAGVSDVGFTRAVTVPAVGAGLTSPLTAGTGHRRPLPMVARHADAWHAAFPDGVPRIPPTSLTSSARTPPSGVARTAARRAWACLTTFVSPSATMK